jgi:hypothetical protein
VRESPHEKKAGKCSGGHIIDFDTQSDEFCSNLQKKLEAAAENRYRSQRAAKICCRRCAVVIAVSSSTALFVFAVPISFVSPGE